MFEPWQVLQRNTELLVSVTVLQPFTSSRLSTSNGHVRHNCQIMLGSSVLPK